MPDDTRKLIEYVVVVMLDGTNYVGELRNDDPTKERYVRVLDAPTTVRFLNAND